MKKPKIPDGSSIEELARFWDTHDACDFEDELEEVAEPIFENRRRRVMVIHLETGEAEAIAETAKAQGVEKEALIRHWVLEKLEESR